MQAPGQLSTAERVGDEDTDDLRVVWLTVEEEGAALVVDFFSIVH